MAPEPGARNPKRAVALGEALVKIRDSSPGYRNTLGAAQVAAEDWEAAIPNLERSLELAKPDDITGACSALLLAQAYFRTNRIDQAKASLETGDRLLEQLQQKHPDVLRIREETFRLLESGPNAQSLKSRGRCP